MSAAELASEASRGSKRMVEQTERYEQTNKRMSEWAGTSVWILGSPEPECGVGGKKEALPVGLGLTAFYGGKLVVAK